MIKTKLISTLSLALLYLFSPGQATTGNVREFVTRTYVHGIPYQEAKAFGAQAVTELTTLLYDPNYEEYRPNIVSTLGMIGDERAITPLKNYLYSQKGEVSYSTFISVLAVFQAMGYIAQNGNRESLDMLISWSDPDYLNKTDLNFSYKNYKGALLGSSVSSLAIQGLGISGTQEALTVLEKLNATTKLRANTNLNNSVTSAIRLNKRVKTEGAAKVFGKEGQQ